MQHNINEKSVIARIDADTEQLRETATSIVNNGSIAVLGSGASGSAIFIVGIPEEIDIDAGEVLRELANYVGGGGGGPPNFAQGGRPNVDTLDDALADTPEILRSSLNQ